eukprot:tig00021518_g22045.t1
MYSAAVVMHIRKPDPEGPFEINRDGPAMVSAALALAQEALPGAGVVSEVMITGCQLFVNYDRRASGGSGASGTRCSEHDLAPPGGAAPSSRQELLADFVKSYHASTSAAADGDLDPEAKQDAKQDPRAMQMGTIMRGGSDEVLDMFAVEPPVPGRPFEPARDVPVVMEGAKALIDAGLRPKCRREEGGLLVLPPEAIAASCSGTPAAALGPSETTTTTRPAPAPSGMPGLRRGFFNASSKPRSPAPSKSDRWPSICPPTESAANVAVDPAPTRTAPQPATARPRAALPDDVVELEEPEGLGAPAPFPPTSDLVSLRVAYERNHPSLRGRLLALCDRDRPRGDPDNPRRLVVPVDVLGPGEGGRPAGALVEYEEAVVAAKAKLGLGLAIDSGPPEFENARWTVIPPMFVGASEDVLFVRAVHEVAPVFDVDAVCGVGGAELPVVRLFLLMYLESFPGFAEHPIVVCGRRLDPSDCEALEAPSSAFNVDAIVAVEAPRPHAPSAAVHHGNSVTGAIFGALAKLGSELPVDSFVVLNMKRDTIDVKSGCGYMHHSKLHFDRSGYLPPVVENPEGMSLPPIQFSAFHFAVCNDDGTNCENVMFCNVGWLMCGSDVDGPQLQHAPKTRAELLHMLLWAYDTRFRPRPLSSSSSSSGSSSGGAWRDPVAVFAQTERSAEMGAEGPSDLQLCSGFVTFVGVRVPELETGRPFDAARDSSAVVDSAHAFLDALPLLDEQSCWAFVELVPPHFAAPSQASQEAASQQTAEAKARSAGAGRSKSSKAAPADDAAARASAKRGARRAGQGGEGGPGPGPGEELQGVVRRIREQQRRREEQERKAREAEAERRRRAEEARREAAARAAEEAQGAAARAQRELEQQTLASKAAAERLVRRSEWAKARALLEGVLARDPDCLPSRLARLSAPRPARPARQPAPLFRA